MAAFDGINVVAGRTGVLWNAALRFALPDSNPPTITVRAYASLAANVGPIMQLVVAGSTVEVRSTTATDCVFVLPAPVGRGARMDVVFTNDGTNGIEDRNLNVESLTVSGATLLPNSPGVTLNRARVPLPSTA